LDSEPTQSAVKTEVAEEADDANKAAEVTDDELPDFGDAEDAAPAAASTAPKAEVVVPQRAMPDYADLVDDDDDAPAHSAPGVAKKEEVEESKAAVRPDAVLMVGVQRLTRTHLAEIFASKNLPCFQRLEWIADEKVICVFENNEAAATALRGALDGFDQSDDRPGPGLWRAVRGMIDFRQATLDDMAPVNFKRQHRGGRQVRDYRFWEAAKDIDKTIMENLDAQGVKRDAPTGEDAIAAAVWGDQLEAPPKKKRRKAAPQGENDGAAEAPDILQQMAQKDKEILALKQEEPAEGEAEAGQQNETG